jgi:hypothetical protein
VLRHQGVQPCYAADFWRDRVNALAENSKIGSAIGARPAAREYAMSGTEALAKGMQGCPPLPNSVSYSSAGSDSKQQFADGCYFISYGRDVDIWYQGTLRVELRGGQVLASGDLYAVDMESLAEPVPVGQMPPPGTGVPIFPIADYTFYLRVTKIEPAGPGFVLTLEAHRYFPKDVRKLDGTMYDRWVLESSFTARMMPADAPAGYPQPDKFYVGEIPLNPADPQMTAQMQMGWVAPLMRRAVIEIDCVADTHAPLDNGAGVTWQSVFQSFGWDAKAIDSDHNITKSGSNPLWTTSDADAAMRQHRDNNDLDAEWRYYVLIASQILAPGESDGFMYHARREALFVASQSVFPDQPQFGTLRGKRLDTTNAFLRTVVHEVGHAMGLGHNETGFHFMRPTPSIAQDATADKPFPTNIDWSFDPEDVNRLRHWPDIAVRPGGAGVGLGADLLPPDAKGTRPA